MCITFSVTTNCARNFSSSNVTILYGKELYFFDRVVVVGIVSHVRTMIALSLLDNSTDIKVS
jgi:hypothetical protein